MRRLALAAIGLLILLNPALAGASTYEIKSYQLSIRPDFKAHTVSIITTIEIDNPKFEREFSFTVRKPYHPFRVRGPRHAFRCADEELTITLLQPKRHVRLQITTVSEVDALSASENHRVIDDDSLFLIWSDAFYPVDWNRWAPVTTEMNLPDGFEAVAPGRLTERKASRKGSLMRFESRLPQMAFSVFADRRWTRTSRRIQGIEYVTLLHPESQRFAEQIFLTSPDVLGYFADLHGFTPTEAFSFVTIPGMYGRRAFAGFVGYPPAALEKEMTSYGFDAHETSLLWWGYTSRGSGPGAWQWTEGLGDYVEFMYEEDRGKQRPAIFQKFREQYLASDEKQEPLYSELRGNTPQKYVHGKYPWVMAALRYTVGDEAFRRGLRELFATYRHRTFTFEEFVRVFERASRKSLAGWRKNWFERRGVPELALKFSQVPDDERGKGFWKTSGNIVRGAGLEGFPIEIGFLGEGGARTIKLTNEMSGFVLRRPHPVQVIVDPGNKLLFRLTISSTSPSRHPDNPE